MNFKFEKIKYLIQVLRNLNGISKVINSFKLDKLIQNQLKKINKKNFRI